MPPMKQLGSRRYAQDIASIGRCRSGILLDNGLDAETVKTALAQIDALMVTLATLKRQKEAGEVAPALRLDESDDGAGDAR
jgi:hypothetical protein